MVNYFPNMNLINRLKISLKLFRLTHKLGDIIQRKFITEMSMYQWNHPVSGRSASNLRDYANRKCCSPHFIPKNNRRRLLYVHAFKKKGEAKSQVLCQKTIVFPHWDLTGRTLNSSPYSESSSSKAQKP